MRLAAVIVLIAGAMTQCRQAEPTRFRVVERLTLPSDETRDLAGIATLRWTNADLSKVWTRVSSGGTVTLRSPQLNAGDTITAVMVEFRPSANHNDSPPLLLWSERATLTPGAFARNRRALIPTNGPFAVVPGESLKSEVDQGVGYVFLHFPNGELSATLVESVSIITTKDLIARGPPSITRLTVGDESREGVVVASGQRVSYRITAPARAELAVSVALPSGPVRALITQTTAAGERPLLDLPMGHEGWREFRVALHPGPESTIAFTASDPSGPVYWSVPEILAPDAGGRPNVLLIVVDALRADVPFLPDLSRRSVVFRRAYAAASWTKPSLATLFTSLYPQTHRIGARYYSEGVPDSIPTLQSLLAQAGYQTRQISGNPFSGALTNLDRGFDATVMLRGRDKSFAVTASEVTARAVPWLAEHVRDNFFLYLHLVDAHSPAAAASPKLAYEQAAARIEQQITALYRELERLDVLRDTVIVITADHGEAFGEHGQSGHGQSVFEEEVRIPLVIHAPGRLQPQVNDDPVHHADIMPTVLALAGVAVDERTSLQGRNLLAAAQPKPSQIVSSRFVYPDDLDRPARDGVEATALVDYPWKLIAREQLGRRDYQLYRLDQDPGERHNLASAEPGRVRQLTTILDAFLRQQAAARTRFVAEHLHGRADRRTAPSATLQEHLRSLGYIR